MKAISPKLFRSVWARNISSSCRRLLVADISELPPRIFPSYHETKNNDLLSLRWPSPPKNILLVKKDYSQAATDAVIEFAKHITTTYPSISIICETPLAIDLHGHLGNPVYTTTGASSSTAIHTKTDLVTTFGGDGTILHASSLFAATNSVPPILSFTMGTLGFLSEWKFVDYKHAFREVYMSGAPSTAHRGAVLENRHDVARALDKGAMSASEMKSGWSIIRGKSLGSSRGARVLIRNRLNLGISSASGEQRFLSVTPSDNSRDARQSTAIHALNEVHIHRGADPHLTVVDVLVNKRFLTEAVADGMIVSTPTGSTAYSLSAGGSIVHPLVPSLLLTPICPRSLSFRPLVLPAAVEIVLRLSKKNRGKNVEVVIDGMTLPGGLEVGGEVRITGEVIERRADGWSGGVPCVMRGGQRVGDDGWVGGLNGLLKFNYPLGEER